MWAVIVIVDLVIIAGLLFCIVRAQSRLPREHIERAGYFRVFGAGSEPPSVNVALDLEQQGPADGKMFELEYREEEDI